MRTQPTTISGRHLLALVIGMLLLGVVAAVLGGGAPA
jgi:hypothetical protein